MDRGDDQGDLDKRVSSAANQSGTGSRAENGLLLYIYDNTLWPSQGGKQYANSSPSSM